MNAKRIVFLIFVYTSLYPVQAQISHPSFHYAGNDSVLTHASDQYVSHSFLRTFLMGKNYRKEWSQPTVLPVFRLSQTSFKVKELGGGNQTKSLKLEDSNGKPWALRTIDKDVSGAMPGFLKNSDAQRLTQDQVSSSMPYSSPVIGALARCANIKAAEPTVYFVADDTAFGSYRSLFANTVCMLEERDPGFETTTTTAVVLRQVENDTNVVIDQSSVLKARLLDMLIGDWDRHYDNWRWGILDSAGTRYYQAVPRDRDWAFYISNGLIPKLMRIIRLRFLINFSEKPKYLESLNYKAHIFDGVFLNSLDWKDWQQAIHELQQAWSDECIGQAVKKSPAAIFSLDGESFIKKLKGRRDGLQKAVQQYYRFLSREVQIEGSGSDDIFSVQPAAEGFRLIIYQPKKDNKTERVKVYDRTFLPTETYRVTLNGLGGDDRFEIDEKVATKIKLKLNGGSGKDSYELRGNLPTEVHDAAAEGNMIDNKNKAKIYTE